MAGKIHQTSDGSKRAKHTLILAHGAGAAMDSDFMNVVTEGLVVEGLQVVRFEFPYMEQRRKTGGKRPPDREPVLRDTWLQVVDQVKTDRKRLLIGGKSMGGRIASLIADEANVAGLVCLGYPFHPPGKPDKLRVDHLQSLRTPTLILQGERDPFGNREQVAGYPLSKTVQLHWLTDGEHSFKPRKSSGVSLEENLADAVQAVVSFASQL
ncbi:MAG: dienelactone hydrolase family protein [Pirellulaceae bacterium]|nr:dienelactone hydrolase family protein [Pirellulaceae bacterium]